MKTYIVPVLVAATGILVMSSCRKDPLKNLSGDESRIYITQHSDSVSFSSFHTFSIADSVAVISNNQFQGRSVSDVDTAYINAVKLQMQQQGYTLVNKNQNPDLAITVSRIYNTSTGVFDYGNYWDPYYGSYWDPYYWGYAGYGYYFPSYYVGTYSITEGAISIDIFDLKDAKQTNKISSIWSGLVRGTGTFSAANAASSVQALFKQSTYFKAS
jgi:hypothetical protein